MKLTSSNHWKFLAVLFPIIGTCAFGQPQPGGLGGFFSAWYGVASAVEFLPSDIDNLAMWLDASKAEYVDIAVIDGTNRVETLFDRSGNQADATQTTIGVIPEYVENVFQGNNAALLNFDFLTVTNSFVATNNGASVFIVYERTGSLSGQNIGGMFGFHGNNQINHHPFSDNNFYESFSVSSRQSFSHNYTNLTNIFLYSVIVSLTNSSYYNSGNLLSQKTTSARNPANNFTIGKSLNGFSANGYFCEMLIYEYALTTEDRKKVEGYFAHKWGFTSRLPNDHPYKNTRP